YFLSFGSEGIEIELHPLNVLIGPNASGKSNAIAALGILHATPRDLVTPMAEDGGVREWLWKGDTSQPARIEATVEYPPSSISLRYRLSFTARDHGLEVVDEAIEHEHNQHSSEPEVLFFYRLQGGSPVLNVRTVTSEPEIAHQERTQRY